MLFRRRRVSPITRAVQSTAARLVIHSPAARLLAGSALLVAGAIAVKLASDRDASQLAAERKRRFRLEADEPAKQGISRVARNELDLTIGLLESAPNGGGGADAVHEARKALKRLRALLRVSRPVLDDNRYRRENEILRDAGRELSDARDAQVLVETLDSLLERFADELPPKAFSRLREELVAGAQQAQRNGPSGYDGVLEVLSNARTRVSHWPLPQQDGRASLAEGFEQIYRRGRHARRRAKAERTAENLHELRKRAKDLWHAAQLLEPAAPAKMKRLAKDAHHLSDLLGDDHDLFVLLDYAGEHPELLGPDELELIQSVIGLRSRSLRRQALDAAAELYRRKPRRMVRRLALI
jgi:CHAD domain-containing protein